jgi:hypothetical protein
MTGRTHIIPGGAGVFNIVHKLFLLLWSNGFRSGVFLTGQDRLRVVPDSANVGRRVSSGGRGSLNAGLGTLGRVRALTLILLGRTGITTSGFGGIVVWCGSGGTPTKPGSTPKPASTTRSRTRCVVRLFLLFFVGGHRVRRTPEPGFASGCLFSRLSSSTSHFFGAASRWSSATAAKEPRTVSEHFLIHHRCHRCYIVV